MIFKIITKNSLMDPKLQRGYIGCDRNNYFQSLLLVMFFCWLVGFFFCFLPLPPHGIFVNFYSKPSLSYVFPISMKTRVQVLKPENHESHYILLLPCPSISSITKFCWFYHFTYCSFIIHTAFWGIIPSCLNYCHYLLGSLPAALPPSVLSPKADSEHAEIHITTSVTPQ